jgi:hypothetical protein
MAQKNSIQDLHWGQLTTLWVAVLFVWVVIVGVAFSISPDGQASDKTERGSVGARGYVARTAMHQAVDILTVGASRAMGSVLLQAL